MITVLAHVRFGFETPGTGGNLLLGQIHRNGRQRELKHLVTYFAPPPLK